MKKLNNKGFSLVELIIVIAIMAVLIVVLAPQYLKYVEKSRNSTDVTNATEIVTAIQVFASDPDATTPVPGGAAGTTVATITISDSGGTGIGSAGDFVYDALDDAGLLTGTSLQTRCVSRTNWNEYSIEVKADGKGGLNFEYTADGGDDSETLFRNAMTGARNTTTP